MKRLAVIGSIVALILLAGVLGIRFAHSVLDEFTPLVQEGVLLAKAGRSEDLLSHVQAMDELWERRQFVLGFYARHDELEKVEAALSEVISRTRSGDLASARVGLEQVASLIEHIYRRELPTLNNIL